jgi:hypothetical protein
MESRRSIAKLAAAEAVEVERTNRNIAERATLGGMSTMTTRTNFESFGSKPSAELGNINHFLEANNAKIAQFRAEMNETISMAEQLGIVSDGFSAIGDAIGGSAGNFAKFAAEVLNKIPLLIAQITALTAAKQGEAMASGIASSQKVPFPLNLIALAATVASIVASFSKIPKFEQGGIVPGGMFSGDKVLARVNSGEEILRRDDPRHRYNQGGNPSVIPADIILGDDHIRISYQRAYNRLRKKT